MMCAQPLEQKVVGPRGLYTHTHKDLVTAFLCKLFNDF